MKPKAPQKPMGRPVKTHGRKNRQLGVKLTDSQAERYRRAADADGEDHSDWVRRILDEAADRVLGKG